LLPQTAIKTMSDLEKKGFAGNFHAWVQTAGIIVASAWGVYVFAYKEIAIPKSAPVNVSIDLQLQKTGKNYINVVDEKSLIAVEMQASASNPSTRKVYLLPNYWVVYGIRIRPEASETFNEQAYDKIGDFTIEKHNERTSDDVVAIGIMFFDGVLNPGEKIVRKLVIHVPPNKYDLLHAYTHIPTSTKEWENRLALEYKLKKEDNQVLESWYHVESNGERKLLDDEQITKTANIYELQSAVKYSELSLWR
jgi:hypothetical protein